VAIEIEVEMAIANRGSIVLLHTRDNHLSLMLGCLNGGVAFCVIVVREIVGLIAEKNLTMRPKSPMRNWG
jgi:hypothetical protein